MEHGELGLAARCGLRFCGECCDLGSTNNHYYRQVCAARAKETMREEDVHSLCFYVTVQLTDRGIGQLLRKPQSERPSLLV